MRLSSKCAWLCHMLMFTQFICKLKCLQRILGNWRTWNINLMDPLNLDVLWQSRYAAFRLRSTRNITRESEDKGFTSSRYLVLMVYCCEVEIRQTFITKFHFALHVTTFVVFHVLWKGNLICNVILTKVNFDQNAEDNIFCSLYDSI